jgi:hypothetical protein
MTIDCVGVLPQVIVGIGADGYYEFELPRVPGFSLESRSSCVAGAVRQAVSG